MHLEELTQALYERYQGRCPQADIEQFFRNVIAPAAEVFRQIDSQTTGGWPGTFSSTAYILDDQCF
jgi:hypothetical protein